MSGLECHLISIAESWLGLAGEADRIQALMDPFEPVIPEIQTWTVAKADQKEMEGSKNAAKCIRLAQEARTSVHKSFF
jgi:hypothetical protein